MFEGHYCSKHGPWHPYQLPIALSAVILSYAILAWFQSWSRGESVVLCRIRRELLLCRFSVEAVRCLVQTWKGPLKEGVWCCPIDYVNIELRNRNRSVSIELQHNEPELYETFVGLCVQDLEKLLNAGTIDKGDFGTRTCDFCDTHRPGFRNGCSDCAQVGRSGKGGKREKACRVHSLGHNKTCDECVHQRWSSQEDCRNVVTQTFAAVMHHRLRQAYRTRKYTDVKFPYPQGVEEVSLADLIEDQDNCESFLKSLWSFKSCHNDGSCFFYQYGALSRLQQTPLKFIEGLSWQLIVPYGIALGLITDPRSSTPRAGYWTAQALCRWSAIS